MFYWEQQCSFNKLRLSLGRESIRRNRRRAICLLTPKEILGQAEERIRSEKCVLCSYRRCDLKEELLTSTDQESPNSTGTEVEPLPPDIRPQYGPSGAPSPAVLSAPAARADASPPRPKPEVRHWDRASPPCPKWPFCNFYHISVPIFNCLSAMFFLSPKRCSPFLAWTLGVKSPPFESTLGTFVSL